LASTNEQLASQLKEAHEALYDLQAAVQATPPAKRQQQRQLMERVADAEQVRGASWPECLLCDSNKIWILACTGTQHFWAVGAASDPLACLGQQHTMHSP
jgi:hypothetical protein